MTRFGQAPRNVVLQADCIDTMRPLGTGAVDFFLTDPPYVTRFSDRQGRTVANDDNGRWLRPAFQQMHRVLKPGGFCVSFYGWNRVDLFMEAWRAAGFRVVGHLVVRKRYASSSRFLRYEHEQAYLLAKGNPIRPERPIPDVLDFPYTGNHLHPTQKPVEALAPLIEAFTKPSEIVLDPFCGSGSTLAAARGLGRDWIGIEMDAAHHATATSRMANIARRRAAAGRSAPSPRSRPSDLTGGGSHRHAVKPRRLHSPGDARLARSHARSRDERSAGPIDISANGDYRALMSSRTLASRHCTAPGWGALP